MTLNLLVQGFPDSNCLLLFRPKLVLISKWFRSHGKISLTTLVFVTSDVLCILVQLAGGALFGVTAGKEPGEGGITVDVATNVLLAGLVLQVSLLLPNTIHT